MLFDSQKKQARNICDCISDEARTADTWFEKSMPSEDWPSEDLYLSPGSLDIRPENCISRKGSSKNLSRHVWLAFQQLVANNFWWYTCSGLVLGANNHSSEQLANADSRWPTFTSNSPAGPWPNCRRHRPDMEQRFRSHCRLGESLIYDLANHSWNIQDIFYYPAERKPWKFLMRFPAWSKWFWKQLRDTRLWLNSLSLSRVGSDIIQQSTA